MIPLALVLVPIAAALLCAIPRVARASAALGAVVVMGLALYALAIRPAGLRVAWAAPLDSSFSLGLDSVSALLASACGAIALVAVSSTSRIGDRRAYFALWSCALASACLVLAARDVAVLFVGWESLVLSLAVLVRHWGGEGRHGASLRLAIHGLVGSGLLLIALASIADARGTLDIDALGARPIAAAGQLFPAMLFLAAFAPALAIFPLHVGVTRAFGAAPPVVAMSLSGLLGVTAGYAIVRVCVGLFPQGMAVAAPVLVALAGVGALYAAAVAARQDDMRRGVAFIAMSQQNLVAVALFVGTATSIRGALLLLVANAFAVAATLLAVSATARRTSSFLLSRAGGLGASAPRISAFATVAALAAIGVPGTAAFAGDVLALAGAYERYPGAAAAIVFGVALNAAWAATFIRRAFDGPPHASASRDAGWREAAPILALLVVILAVGIAPRIVTDQLSDDALPAVQAAP